MSHLIRKLVEVYIKVLQNITTTKERNYKNKDREMSGNLKKKMSITTTYLSTPNQMGSQVRGSSPGFRGFDVLQDITSSQLIQVPLVNCPIRFQSTLKQSSVSSGLSLPSGKHITQ